jgi:hypothetical protein
VVSLEGEGASGKSMNIRLARTVPVEGATPPGRRGPGWHGIDGGEQTQFVDGIWKRRLARTARIFNI